MPEFIRVYEAELKRKHTIVAPETLDPDVYELLDEPAVDHNAQPLPPEFGVTRSGQKSASNPDGPSAAPTKEK
jgi:hypothetical protein